MKQSLIIFIAGLLFSSFAYSQSSNVILNGGPTRVDPSGGGNFSGFKVGGQYEYIFKNNSWAVGASIQYLRYKTEPIESLPYMGVGIGRYWPLANIQGKYLFGQSKFQGYIKAMAGYQHSSLYPTGTDGGDAYFKYSSFSFGGGTGLNYHLNEKIFLNAEYELLYLDHNFYGSPLSHSISVGVGFKFKKKLK